MYGSNHLKRMVVFEFLVFWCQTNSVTPGIFIEVLFYWCSHFESGIFLCFCSIMSNDLFVNWKNVWPYSTEPCENLPFVTQLTMCHSLHKNVMKKLECIRSVTVSDLDVMEFKVQIRCLLRIQDCHICAWKDVEQ